MGDLALQPHFIQPTDRVQIARHGVIPPVELHEVQPLPPQAFQRGFHNGAHIIPVQRRQSGKVGHQLGMHPHLGQCLGPMAVGVGGAEGTDQRLNSGVDIRTVKGGDPGLGKGDHILDRSRRIDHTMAARQLPTAPDHPRDVVTGAKFDPGDGHGASGRATAVVSA